MAEPKILILDIETSPNLAHVWGLYKQTVSLDQIHSVGQVIAFAAKWHGAPKRDIEFHSTFNFEIGEVTEIAHIEMVQRAWQLLDEADIVVHWNGTSFDIPHLNREFVLLGMTPPSPYKQVDLLHTARKHFRFTSNKLDHVAQQLGVGRKVGHAGFKLWLGCMAGDRKSWETMRRYNKGDVEITDGVYDEFKPWITSHPHVGLYADDPEINRCGRCGSEDLRKQGFALTNLGKFQRFLCGSCGGWSRGKRNVGAVEVRPT